MTSSEIEEPPTTENEIQILHLEDDAKDAELIQAILDSAGIAAHITRVQSASEFSQALGEGRYDLILADYRLPAYDGISALRFSQGNYPDIPFIFVSGTLGEDAAIDGLTQGATDYVLKNKLARLVPAVQRALDESENRKKRKEAEEALREGEERLRQITSSLREVVWLRDARTRQVLYVNPAFEELTGRTCESFYENRDIVMDAVHPDDKEEVLKALEQRSKGILYGKEHRIIHLDGSVHWVSSRIFPVRNEAGEVYRWASIMEDITERKQAEEELKSAHEQLARSLMFNEALLSAIPTPVFYKDKEGRYLGCNHAFAEFTGVGPDQIKGKTVIELWPSENAEVYHKKDLELMRNPEQQVYEFRVRDKDGIDHPVIFAKNVFRDENNQVAGIVGAFLDITERKQAEIERQAHLQFLESMDRVNRAIQGTNDLEQMMSGVLDIVLSIFDCDRAFLMYPLDPDASSWYSPMERTRPEYPGILALGMDEVPVDTEVARTFRIMLETDGPVKFGPGTPNLLPMDMAERFDVKSFMSMALYPKVGKPWQFGVHQCSYERIWTLEEERLFQEIGRRLSDALSSLLVYRNLQESEERYRQLVDISPDAIVVYSQGRVVLVNPATVRLSGAKSEEDLVGRSVLEFVQPDYREYVQKALEHIQITGESVLFAEENFLRMDGTRLDVEATIVPYRFHGENYMQIIVRDITERKQHEREREVIITVSTALRQARTRTEILSVILDQLVDLFDADGAVLVLPDPQTGGFICEMGRGIIGEKMIGLEIPPGKGICNWVITNKEPYLTNHADRDALFYRPDLLGDSHCLICVPLIAHEQAIGVLWVARPEDFVEQDLRLLTAIADIAANAIHRVTLHEQTEQQLHRLTALHQIDLAISANFDLNITLNVILSNVKDELEVDAASILLLDPVTHTLDYAAAIGFRTRNIEQSHVRLGNGCAGRAAQENRTVFCPDLRQGKETFSRASFLAEEEFVSHYDTPLVVKGQVKGVLEIFHRAVIEPESVWLSYFETLATQAAIAIDNASLFENLQRSNMELTFAYDATIEGWSRALDLRDRETEGHTQRVTEMALELAEKMGMSDADKRDFRRGALLHDIGKLGVPDAILHKPGPLSDEEWEIMRQHPLYAYQMLSPITYLKRALDIPYYHHEKWDGSGYPRGLKGDEIPLSARMFAVVDVFDALTSDRPYGNAWPREKAYRYIRKQAGKHFDPRIVKVFLEKR
ncbi:MAG: PAS domain S-box protein [Chloroflexota bacterium]